MGWSAVSNARCPTSWRQCTYVPKVSQLEVLILHEWQPDTLSIHTYTQDWQCLCGSEVMVSHISSLQRKGDFGTSATGIQTKTKRIFTRPTTDRNTLWIYIFVYQNKSKMCLLWRVWEAGIKEKDAQAITHTLHRIQSDWNRSEKTWTEIEKEGFLKVHRGKHHEKATAADIVCN